MDAGFGENKWTAFFFCCEQKERPSIRMRIRLVETQEAAKAVKSVKAVKAIIIEFHQGLMVEDCVFGHNYKEPLKSFLGPCNLIGGGFARNPYWMCATMFVGIGSVMRRARLDMLVECFEY